MIYLALPHLISFVTDRLIFIMSNITLKVALLKRVFFFLWMVT